MKKLLPFVGVLLLAAACSEAPSAPATPKKSPAVSRHDDFCQSGYVIAYDENGNPYCVPIDGGP